MSAALIALTVFGCGSGEEKSELAFPDLDYSEEWLDFGEVNWGEPNTRDLVIRNRGDLAVGIAEIELLQDGMEDNFFLLYDFAEASCDARANAQAKGTTDSGKPKDTGYYPDSADTGADSIAGRVLNPQCDLPIHITFDPTDLGRVYAGLRIVTAEELNESGQGDPAFYQDPDENWKTIILQGDAVKEEGKALVTPRTIDFGVVWAEVSESRYVAIENVGEGELRLDGFEFTADCGATFEVTQGFEPPLTLDGGGSTVLEVTMSPPTAEDVDPIDCQLRVYSNDPNDPQINVRLLGNLVGHPDDKAPTLELIRPAPGHVVDGASLELELDMTDVNQPADTLTCRIRKYWYDTEEFKILSDSIDQVGCSPSSSGYLLAEVPLTELEVGPQTILVKVNDASGQVAEASTTVVYLTDFPANDADGDGWVATADGGRDCNDADINTYPEAAEQFDGIDNNCDGDIDEGTDGYDDDGDSFTEAEGDCDDASNLTFPGAPEGVAADNRDNDCDGLIDEGTSGYDDDGDGFDEANNDCDDTDPAINPGAVEICDGIDNDCDSFQDQQDGCIATDTEPMIIGGMRAEKTDIGVGETVTLAVLGFDPDGDPISFAWTEPSSLSSTGYRAIDNTTGSTVTFTAPNEISSGSGQQAYELQIEIQDIDGNRDWIFGEITVHEEPVILDKVVTNPAGCGNSSDEALLIPVLPLLLLALRRRR